jgi:methionyl-tRNA formyltransferase
MTRVVFMGTPDYAVPSLEALCAHHQVALVITQPDRKQGRGQKLSPPPVKTTALRYGLPVWQPNTLRNPEAIDRLRATGADVYITAAIGFILPPAVLALPPHGCLNLHASLLPRWRGAAPVSAAILNGDPETGITLMQTDEGLDTGPILAQVRCPIAPDDTTETLTHRLAHMGADLLIAVLPRWINGEIIPQTQPSEGATFSQRLSKEAGWIDWRQPASLIERMTRAYDPWPGAYTTYRGRRLKIVRAEALPDWPHALSPGHAILVPDKRIAVTTGRGVLVLREIQLAGKRAMSPDALWRGYPDFVGSALGQTDQMPGQSR